MQHSVSYDTVVYCNVKLISNIGLAQIQMQAVDFRAAPQNLCLVLLRYC